MLTSTTNLISSLSHQLRGTKKILQDVPFDTCIAMTVDVAELHVLEQDAFEILRLIRSWQNKLTSVHRIPPEVLALIPDFWDTHDRDKDVIALTHVCQAWRKIFTSRSSLWTDFDCVGVDKTRVYFERSKSSPIINSSLDRGARILPDDPFLEIIPRVFHRLNSLSIQGTPRNLQDITTHLSSPAPRLEYLSIDCGHKSEPAHNPVLTNLLFNGDLSSLRTLHLRCVRTELHWRNMSNLTSFKLGWTLPGEVSVKQLVDFFEGAPRLRRIELTSATPTSAAENCRSVPLARLKRMNIYESGPSSLLLDHLLIPVGAKLAIHADFDRSPIEDYLPRSLDNLRNLSNFTEILLHPKVHRPFMRFSGPNGKVNIVPQISQISQISPFDTTCWLLEALARFDTSMTERLEIVRGDIPFMDFLYRALLPMEALRTLTISQMGTPYTFIAPLDPSRGSSGVLVCPKLEVLVLCIDRGVFSISNVIRMVAERESRGAKLKSLRIVCQRKFSQADILELEKHVLHVECGPEVDVASDESGGSDEED